MIMLFNVKISNLFRCKILEYEPKLVNFLFLRIIPKQHYSEIMQIVVKFQTKAIFSAIKKLVLLIILIFEIIFQFLFRNY